MQIRLAAILFFTVVLVVGFALPQPVPAAAPADVDLAQVVGDLKNGGYVIFFRHAATNWSEQGKEEGMKSSGRFSLTDCKTQRNLSDAGRVQADRLGKAFRALGIPVSRIAASDYCRTQETARLAFGWAEHSSLLTPDGEPVSRAEALKRLVNIPTMIKHNTVLVGHGDMMRSGFGIDLSEMEAAVLKADAKGKPQMLARVRVEQWEKLAAEELAAQTGAGQDETRATDR
jgi:phosphohistidine phosphatase SixA